MAKQTINIGTSPNDGTGDPLRTAFQKTNENFDELYEVSANSLTEIPTVFNHIELTERHGPTGNVVTFVRQANQNISDNIGSGLSLARSNNGQGLYNSAVESSFNRNVSPANTEWNWTGWDNLDDVKVRHYRTWTEALRKKVGTNIVGAELVMHDITNDKYYKIKFTQWDLGGVDGANGSFTYTRELIDTTTEVGVVFEDGTNQITASNKLDWPVVWLDNNNYTLRLIDAERTLRGYDMTISVPRDSDVNFPIGTEINIQVEGTEITLERVQHIEETEAELFLSGYDNSTSSIILPPRSFNKIIKTDANKWTVVRNKIPLDISQLTDDEGLLGQGSGDIFGEDGVLDLPNGGTIAEGVVTDNPTIELTPANPEAESQKLVIKGGGPGFSNTENGITITTYNLTAASGNTAYFEVFSQYAGETFYWWVDNYSPGQEFSPDNGEITLSEFGYANIEFTVNDDTVPLRIYVADTLYNAYANSKGAVSVTVNGESQDSYHLHLTTGDLSETSIFLGTDELNVRTTTNGTIQITTPTEGVNVWEFGNDGTLTLPYGGDIVDRNGDSVLGGGSGDTGDITFDGANISAPNEQTIRIQAKDDDSVVRAYFRLDPDDGVAEMRAVSSRSTEYFSTSNWTTAEWTGAGGGGNIAFTNAADLISFLNNQYNRGINREFSINEGDYIAYIGFGGDDNNITLYTDASPPADPTTVSSIEFRYRRESRIEIDYDDDEINIIGRGLDVDIETDEQIDISANGSVEISSDTSIALLNNSATNSIIIRTNNNNTNQAWEFAADGKLTLPGALVKSTVSKTGANLFANSANFEVASVDEDGAVTEITVINSPNPNWTTGTNGNALGDVNFTVTVDGSGNALVTVDGGGTGHFIGETFNLSAESLGGTTPTPTALDLTKSVNKLTVGSYTLADGVEGQIMYLVRQPDTDSEVEIFVTNGRVGNSSYTDIAFFPFNGSGSGNMTTLIFTDGAWQSDGGSWD